VEIFFLPSSERRYSCRVRLITINGDTVVADLVGIGIETHLAIDDHDFGRIAYKAGVNAGGSVELRALPTRALEVRELRIAGADASEFAFDPSFTPPNENVPSTWWHMQPGEKRMIPLLFVPRDTGAKSATIEVIGDHAACDDSVGALAGNSFVAGAVSPAIDLGSTLGCMGLAGEVTIHNIGGIAYRIDAVTLLDDTARFALAAVALPVTLPPDSTFALGVIFNPHTTGAAMARVRFVLARTDGSGQLDTVETTVAAATRPLAARAHIDRSYRAAPGGKLTVPVLLDEPLDSALVEELVIALPRLTHVSILNASTSDAASILDGTILAGWSMTVDASSRDSVRIHLRAPKGKFLKGTGELLHLPVGTFLRDSMGSEFPFTVELTDRPCAAVTPRAGRIALDSICGMSLRLIELSTSSYALDGNRPNPFNPTTEISFSLGLDGPTSLVIYDGDGRDVAHLVDGYLAAGRYSIIWDAGSFPSGAYRYALRSGEWMRDGVMVLAK
jgi:hypothetical protein